MTCIKSHAIISCMSKRPVVMLSCRVPAHIDRMVEFQAYKYNVSKQQIMRQALRMWLASKHKPVRSRAA